MIKRICKYCHKPTSDLHGTHASCRATQKYFHEEERRRVKDDRPLWLRQLSRSLMR